MSRRYKEGDVDTLEAEAYRAGVNSCASHWEEERGEYEAKIAELEQELEKAKTITGETSDGYHTFNELYDHRCLLFIAWVISDGKPGYSYWLKEHFKGWDLIVCNIKGVGQVSYHVPIKYRALYEKQLPIHTLEQHEYDGHTSTDVLKRLEEWIRG